MQDSRLSKYKLLLFYIFTLKIVVYSYNAILHRSKKENYWYVQQQGWVLQALFGVKEASYKKLCNLWFDLYKVQEELKLVSNSRSQIRG